MNSHTRPPVIALLVESGRNVVSMIAITAERFGELLAAEARLAAVEAERDEWKIGANEGLHTAEQLAARLAAVEALCDRTGCGPDAWLYVIDVLAAARGDAQDRPAMDAINESKPPADHIAIFDGEPATPDTATAPPFAGTADEWRARWEEAARYGLIHKRDAENRGERIDRLRRAVADLRAERDRFESLLRFTEREYNRDVTEATNAAIKAERERDALRTRVTAVRDWMGQDNDDAAYDLAIVALNQALSGTDGRG